jgi:hypothetical protein
MSSLPSTHERARLRRSLIQLATLLVLTLLASGLVSLFALWSMDRLHARDELDQGRLLSAVNSARSAQVEFKIQVQNWKNLLLRGGNPNDYDAAKKEFDAAELGTDTGLMALAAWAGTADKSDLENRIRQLLADHARIGAAYRAAMPSEGASYPARDRADTAVRGIDRTLNESLDDLVADMLRNDQRRAAEIGMEERERFSLLSRVIWISIGLSLGLVSALLWRTLRDPALHA